ncbi:MAG TPA: XrtA/PEP-CTERM system histidine kinase PrsK [Luteitalea sp.]|nr:XrtA/PEP-CTERM system histidine kinase PrsK [Luteitalea sp.]
MQLFSWFPFAAALASIGLALLSVVRKTPSPATWCFAFGMVVLAADSLCTGLSLRTVHIDEMLTWLTRGLIVKAFLPGAWVGFSLTYSRGDWRETVRRWTMPLAVLAGVPVAVALNFREELLQLVPLPDDSGARLLRSGGAAVMLQSTLLVAFVLALMNLEQTFRAAVGTSRWRIKYVVLGLAVIFGAQIYVRSQAILYSAHDVSLAGVESSGLLLGCLLLVLAYARAGWVEADVYPSRAVLRSSVTFLIVGCYLLVVGVLAQAVRYAGGAESFQLQAFVVLLGMVGLAVLVLSDRVRQRVQEFVARHFSKAQHDSARIWTELSGRLANVRDEETLSDASARFLASAFDVLAVTVWLRDSDGALISRAATAAAASLTTSPPVLPAAVVEGVRERTLPFDVDDVDEIWAEELRQRNPSTFANGGHRWCVPLHSVNGIEGLLVLADRVNGAPYSLEERELLNSIASQMTSTLLNLRLGDEVARARELEAFRTMSAFFVHDLKNAAASLNLMLKNLPVHFDDPAFRADALRGIGNTARRIDEMITRLGAVRQAPRLTRHRTDPTELVADVTEGLVPMPGIIIDKDLQPVPPVLLDREQIASVVTNLLLNARDAVGAAGRITVQTAHVDDRVLLVVADDGCGMTRTFLRDGLFRPFQSTKSKGLGIGMFQSRLVVEAHGGSIQVDSEVGKGTTVRVMLPIEEAR